MLKKLKLTNFRQHHANTVEFVPGVNTIIGANNAGKSTIAEAIEFALFGAKALRDTGTAYVSDGCKNGSAILVLDIGNDVYQVGRDSAAAKVLKNGHPEADYKANVTRYIGQLTGVTQAGFRLGHYVRQKELAAFSALRPGKRQETIEKMLKIHAVDRVLAMLKEKADGLDTELKALLVQTADADALTVDLCTARDERSKLKPVIVDEESIIAQRALVTNARELLAVYEAHESERARLAEELEGEHTLLEDRRLLELELSALSTVTDNDLSQLMVKLSEMQKTEVQAAKMSVIKAELEKPLEVVAAVEVPDDSECQRWRTAISVADSNLNTVRKLKGLTKCPTCLSVIADAESLIKSLEETLGQVKTEGQPIIDAYNSKLRLATENNEKFKAYTAESNRRNVLLSTYVEVEFNQEEKKVLERELNESRQTNDKYKDLKHKLEIVEYKLGQLSETKIRLAELITETSGVQYDELQQSYNDKLTALELEETQLKEMRDLAIKTATDIARLDGRIEELQRSVDSAIILRQAITEAENKLSEVRCNFETYQKFKKYLTAKIRPMIATVAETLFHKVTKNRYAAYQLGNDYDIIVTTHAGFIRRLSTISGSENDLANLCLRLAIATLRSNKLVGNLGFIILDEIASSFDEERTKQTLEGLLELKDIIPQIINITHKQVEMKFADKLITVKELNHKAIIV